MIARGEPGREAVAGEAVVRLTANDAPVGTWTASPVDLESLGAGRLMALGYLRGAADVLDIRAAPDDGLRAFRVEATIPGDRVAVGVEERDHRRWHGCGLRYLLDCRRDLLGDGRSPGAGLPRALASGETDALAAVAEQVRRLTDVARQAPGSGALHATGLSDGTRVTHAGREVDPGCGADRAIGSALLAADPLSALGLVCTAVVGGGIAERAARAGLAWIATRSVPTTLALEIAGAAGIPIVARLDVDARVYPPEDR